MSLKSPLQSQGAQFIFPAEDYDIALANDELCGDSTAAGLYQQVATVFFTTGGTAGGKFTIQKVSRRRWRAKIGILTEGFSI
ncbi:hypothetical protein MCACP_07400 [Neomoorella carbonis]